MRDSEISGMSEKSEDRAEIKHLQLLGAHWLWSEHKSLRTYLF